MNENSELNGKEKFLRKILIVLIILIAAVVVMGIVNQTYNINQDYILFPVFLMLSTIFLAIYSFNAFTTGNLVKSWCNRQLYMLIFNSIKNNSLIPDEKASQLTIKLFGFFTLIIALSCVALGSYSLCTNN